MKLSDWYYQHLGKLLIIPILILIVSIIVIAVTFQKTDDIIYKDVSLTGGVSARVEVPADIHQVQAVLEEKLGTQVIVKELKEFGSDTPTGFTVEVAEVESPVLENALEEILKVPLTEDNFSLEQTGSRLGESFYKQMLTAVLFAFLFMAIVVFVTFRSFIPSVAVVAAAFFDILATIAFLDVIHFPISTAGIAALLLLIGYSIDTDVLLTTRVLKREGAVKDQIFSSISTGVTMTMTALVAVLAGLLLTNSDVIREIFLIMLVGLIFDLISTWITNVYIIRSYAEHKK